jgi:hypothetical protein
MIPLTMITLSGFHCNTIKIPISDERYLDVSNFENHLFYIRQRELFPAKMAIQKCQPSTWYLSGPVGQVPLGSASSETFRILQYCMFTWQEP